MVVTCARKFNHEHYPIRDNEDSPYSDVINIECFGSNPKRHSSGGGEWGEFNSRYWMSVYRLDSIVFITTSSFFNHVLHPGKGTSQNPGSDIYTGSRPFSEKVTYNVGKYLYQRRAELKGYIDFHAYSELWMSPWGYTNAYPPHYDQQVRTNLFPSGMLIDIITFSCLVPLRVFKRLKEKGTHSPT